jgi:hypothetical protein
MLDEFQNWEDSFTVKSAKLCNIAMQMSPQDQTVGSYLYQNFLHNKIPKLQQRIFQLKRQLIK